MTRTGPLQWRTGLGWLVLGGGGDWRTGETGEVDAAVLGWADLTRPIAVLLAAGLSVADGEALVEYYIDLGAPSGGLVPIRKAADARRDNNCSEIGGAGLIVVTDSPNPLQLVEALREEPAAEAMDEAFRSGAAVTGIGTGAAAFGAWVAAGSVGGAPQKAWAWLENGIIEPDFRGTQPAGRLRSMLREHPECLGIGLPRGGALALGPGGDVVTIGPTEVTVVVGAENESESA